MHWRCVSWLWQPVVTKKARILDVVYNASNNELVRTKTIVKNCIVQIDSTPFRQWYELHYHSKLAAKKKTDDGAAAATTEEEKKQSAHLARKIAARKADHVLDAKLSEVRSCVERDCVSASVWERRGRESGWEGGELSDPVCAVTGFCVSGRVPLSVFPVCCLLASGFCLVFVLFVVVCGCVDVTASTWSVWSVPLRVPPEWLFCRLLCVLARVLSFVNVGHSSYLLYIPPQVEFVYVCRPESCDTCAWHGTLMDLFLHLSVACFSNSPRVECWPASRRDPARAVVPTVTFWRARSWSSTRSSC